jgi:hypothetical protein
MVKIMGNDDNQNGDSRAFKKKVGREPDLHPRTGKPVHPGLKLIRPGEVRGKRGPGKYTGPVKEAIEMVAQGLGGVERLIKWAQMNNENETVFWSRIWTRLLPLQVYSRSEAVVDVTYRSVELVTAEMKERGFNQKHIDVLLEDLRE